jgi:transcriptional regulator with XRE-family HTH domain
MTQAEVAAKMGVSQSVLARIESSLGSRKHALSLETLRKSTNACGKRLVICLQ